MIKEALNNINEKISKKDLQYLLDKTEIEAQKIVDKDWTKFTPRVANNGFCDLFAYEFIKKFKGGELWETYDSDGGRTNGHVWVKYKGKFYDAEVPEGVKDYKDIPYIIRSTKHFGEPPEVSRLSE